LATHDTRELILPTTVEIVDSITLL